MSELALPEPTHNTTVSNLPARAGELAEWAQAASATYAVAQQLASTSFIPRAMQGKPDDVTAAILAGQELGFSPMTSVQTFHVIEGRASLSALSMRALAQSRGHEIIVDESTASRCVMRGRRHGTRDYAKVEWTIERATKAGLANKNVWKQHPTSMLLARCTAELVRLIAADAILGMPYSAEEITDGGVSDSSVPAPVAVEAPKPEKRQLKTTRTTKKKPAPKPETEAPAQNTSKPSDAQMRKMHTVMGAYLGSECTREDRLQLVTEIVGRKVETSNDLTTGEVSKVIDHVENS